MISSLHNNILYDCKNCFDYLLINRLIIAAQASVDNLCSASSSSPRSVERCRPCCGLKSLPFALVHCQRLCSRHIQPQFLQILGDDIFPLGSRVGPFCILYDLVSILASASGFSSPFSLNAPTSAAWVLLINELHGADWFHSRFSSHFCIANFAARGY